MTNIIKRLEELNIILPKASKPVANYSPFTVNGDMVYVSGQIPFKNGELIYKGKVGKDLKVEDAKKASALCLINTLAVLNDATKENLDSVKSCIKINVFINSADNFYDQPLVADGASDLIKEIFNENGNHARSAVSCSSLPINAAVEIDSIFQLSL
ncbi:MAG: hypothetical protein CFH34_00799 [Alphaproteobacteria bacterium MarineAlpha9_Bin4]|nr:hypothetical protein [Pelagibacterales bacterium]PPR26682.1 MAG: hypothetical protein CFH34_00799 [Alphaproteobacteria bacterium MarineAlpha9_Bin4]|tara:strand:- start:47 stop:514 length:468 start_codon:yes stop_codon:yes gene_type:complete